MNIEKFLIIHPSRGRPDMAVNSANLLMGNRTSEKEFHYVFSLDSDDPSIPKYWETVKRLSFPHTVLVDKNRTAIEAINRAAATLKDEDIIINMNDDFASTKGWDSRLIAFVGGLTVREYLIQPTDMDNGENIPVVQIMSAHLYKMLGYLLPPCYESMYADNDLLESCKLLCVVFRCTGLGFDHRHPNYGKGVWDETYARENKPGAYEFGLEVLKRRRIEKFGLKLDI